MSSVIVLDDREADRSLLSTVLGYAGHDVREATSAEEALELALAQPPDLIISDILMPGTNGYEFVRRLRESPEIADTLVMFATANYVEGEVKRLSDACGVRHFLEKPTDPQTVIEKVNAALGSETELARPVSGEAFDREQVQVLNDKLVQKVEQLEQLNEERRRLIVQLLHAQEEERREIAGAIHDDPIQTVAAVAMRLEALETQVSDGEREAIARLREDVGAAIESLRELVFELEPIALRLQGLEVALRGYLERMREDGIAVELDFMAGYEPDEATRGLLYRVAREALANVRKHAQASRVNVVVDDRGGSWIVEVSDDGQGFDVEQAMVVRPGHLGLASVRERIETAGGSLEISSTLGRGSSVTIRVPPLGGDG